MKRLSIIFPEAGCASLITEEIRDTPREGEVLIKVLRSTVSSGTERANLLGDPNVSVHVPESGAKAVFPRRSGYSSVGIVEAVGSAVTKVKAGDRVACSWSTHSEYCLLDEKKVTRIEDTAIPDSAGALVHIATFPLAAIRKCRLEIGESALVMGLGVLGRIAVQLLRAAGAAPVIAADPIPAKREEALAEGADYALDPGAEGFADEVKRLTGGGVRVAIEVTGVGAALDETLDCMAPLGRVALLGCTRDRNFTIDYYRKVHGPGITLIGAHTAARPKTESYPGYFTEEDDKKTVLALTSFGRLRLEKLVGEVHSPLDAPKVYHRLATEKGFPLVQFDWTDRGGTK